MGERESVCVREKKEGGKEKEKRDKTIEMTGRQKRDEVGNSYEEKTTNRQIDRQTD